MKLPPVAFRAMTLSSPRPPAGSHFAGTRDEILFSGRPITLRLPHLNERDRQDLNELAEMQLNFNRSRAAVVLSKLAQEQEVNLSGYEPDEQFELTDALYGTSVALGTNMELGHALLKAAYALVKEINPEQLGSFQQDTFPSLRQKIMRDLNYYEPVPGYVPDPPKKPGWGARKLHEAMRRLEEGQDRNPN